MFTQAGSLFQHLFVHVRQVIMDVAVKFVIIVNRIHGNFQGFDRRIISLSTISSAIAVVPVYRLPTRISVNAPIQIQAAIAN